MKTIILTFAFLGFGLILVLGFLNAFHRRGFGRSVVLTWILLSAYTFALVMIGSYWVPGNPELNDAFPEGTNFMAFCVGGWMYGMMTSGLGLLGRRLVDRHKEKLQNKAIQATPQ